MALKRKPLAFAELDEREPPGKGKRAILRTPAEVEAEQALVAAPPVTDKHTAGTLEIKKSRNQEIKKSGDGDEVELPTNVSIDPADRATYTKSTYRLRTEALNALDDMKRVLKRQYGIKVNLELLVEEAILESYRDLREHGEESAVLIKLERATRP